MNELELARLIEDEAKELQDLRDRDVLLAIRDIVLTNKPIPKDLQEQWIRIKANQQEASWRIER